jgi:hypothetical protein
LIRDATTNAAAFIEGLELEDFLADPKTRYAVSMGFGRHRRERRPPGEI